MGLSQCFHSNPIFPRALQTDEGAIQSVAGFVFIGQLAAGLTGGEVFAAQRNFR